MTLNPIHHRCFIPIVTFFLLITGISLPTKGLAQEEEYLEEMVIYFSVPRIGGTDISAVIGENYVYLSVIEIFDFLKIKNSYTTGFDSINGFFITEDAPYNIDRVNNKIIFRDKEFQLKAGDIIRSETNLFLKSDYFGQVFGLDCSFSFRSLSVTMNTSIELPVIREMRQSQMRKSLGQISGEIVADTVIGRRFPLVHFGMADWSAILTQEIKGPKEARLSLNLGGVILGGETNINLNYTTNAPFQEKNQFYQWRYANNKHKALRQVILGKINTFSTATINSPVLGIQITNTPTTYRQSFGTYTLSDVTEPGWTVELYVNNVLVDYKQADASGFYTFEVPMVYGNTNVKLQFYGPWGEERSKEQTLNIPYNFLPTGNFEYRVSAGVVSDTLWSKFSRVDMDYGITRFMTIGAGVEYLSSVTSGQIMPFLHTSVRLAPGLLLTGEYNHGVNAKGILSWRLPSDIQLEVNYTRYDKNQTAINTNYLEERRIAMSIPIRIKQYSLFSRITLNQIIMPSTRYTAAEVLLSGSFLGVNTNLTTYATFSSTAKTNIYSSLSLSVRLPASFILTPQTQFNYTQGKFVSLRVALEKRLFTDGYLNVSFERNFMSDITNVELGLRYDFSFAQIGFSARKSNKTYSFVETASGSIMTDPRSRLITVNSRSSVGKGGMILYPFLDLNWNGKRDKGEPKAFGLEVQVSGGRIRYIEKDTVTRIYDLQPYAQYLVTLNGSKFDNISWRMHNQTMSVTVDPNQFKRIEVPVVVVGEASGQVYLRDKNTLRGQGRITIQFYKNDTVKISSTLTESDGYFSFMGLAPGDYLATIDPEQMRKLNMRATPAFIPFTVEPSVDGDYIYDLEFEIQSNAPVSIPVVTPAPATVPVTVPATETTPASAKKAIPAPVIATTPAKDTIPSAVIPKAAEPAPVPKTAAKDTVAPPLVQPPAGQKREPGVTPSKPEPAARVKESPVQSGYRLQFLVTDKPLDSGSTYFARLKKRLPILEITAIREEDGRYHYVSQHFRTRREALHWMRLVNGMGWEDCLLRWV